MGVVKRYCEDCDGVNSGGFFDDICMIQELSEYDQYRFDNGGNNYGCQVPAKVWKEANDRFGEFNCNFTICNKLQEEHKKRTATTKQNLTGGINK